MHSQPAQNDKFMQGMDKPPRPEAIVPDQIGTLSQVGTNSYMAYAMWELMQGVSIRLEKFLLGPIVN